MRRSAARTLKRWPWGLIASIGMIVLVELVVARHDEDFTDMSHFNWRYAGHKARSDEAKVPILLLGSSQSKMGILPRVIERETGKRAFNLAACGASAPTTYFLLRRAIESGARPEAIVFDCPCSPFKRTEPDNMGEFLLYNQRRWPELLDLRETIDLSLASGRSEFFGRTMLAEFLPSYRSRLEIRPYLKGGHREQPKKAFTVLEVTRRNWQENLGTAIFARNPSFEEKHRGDTVTNEPRPEPPTFYLNPLNKLYTRRMLDLAAAHGIRVFWVIPPFVMSDQVTRNKKGQDAHVTRFVSAMQARYPNVVVIDARRTAYPAQAFLDDIHMNGPGAEVFTAEIASIVRQHLAQPPSGRVWVTMAPCRSFNPPDVKSFEDLSESELALRSAADQEKAAAVAQSAPAKPQQQRR